MKFVKLYIIFVLMSLNVFSNQPIIKENISIKYRVEDQSMSTPMSPIEDMFFDWYYTSKPVNIKFDESLLHLYYDNNTTFIKKNVTKVDEEIIYDDNIKTRETFFYVDNENSFDTITLILDHEVEYIQLVLPTKNSKDEYIGYTSYRKFIKDDKTLSLK